MPRRLRLPRGLRRLDTLLRLLQRRTDRRRGALWNEFVRWFDRLELSENAILFGFAVLIGAGGALAVVAFYGMIDLAFAALYRWPGLNLTRTALVAYRSAVTAVGLLLAWWIVRRFAAGHPGLNIPDVQRRGNDGTRPAPAGDVCAPPAAPRRSPERSGAGLPFRTAPVTDYSFVHFTTPATSTYAGG